MFLKSDPKLTINKAVRIKVQYLLYHVITSPIFLNTDHTFRTLQNETRPVTDLTLR